jgi:uncharacterized FAD-dependent dehydrogenase
VDVVDLKKVNVDHLVNEDSNYCFGEGGAGTYSDGKLYTRSKKKRRCYAGFRTVCCFCSPDILIEAHPHIGTNKLPQIIQDIREKIIECGGQVLKPFDRYFSKNNEVQGVTHTGETILANKLILYRTFSS